MLAVHQQRLAGTSSCPPVAPATKQRWRAQLLLAEHWTGPSYEAQPLQQHGAPNGVDESLPAALSHDALLSNNK
jgi:hypothetical protein